MSWSDRGPGARNVAFLLLSGSILLLLMADVAFMLVSTSVDSSLYRRIGGAAKGTG